jgi:predicted NAD-dependent protein-ADP-ribosyltransferase YbiA (DUF1768 family)
MNNMGDTINNFTGEYSYLDNSYFAHIKIGYITFTCVEAAYQALRVCDDNLAGMFSGLSGKEARRLGMSVTEKKNWDDIKEEMLYKLTLEKFRQNPCLGDKLLSTGDAPIVNEFNGKALMRVRDYLRHYN